MRCDFGVAGLGEPRCESLLFESDLFTERGGELPLGDVSGDFLRGRSEGDDEEAEAAASNALSDNLITGDLRPLRSQPTGLRPYLGGILLGGVRLDFRPCTCDGDGPILGEAVNGRGERRSMLLGGGDIELYGREALPRWGAVCLTATVASELCRVCIMVVGWDALSRFFKAPRCGAGGRAAVVRCFISLGAAVRFELVLEVVLSHSTENSER